MIWLIQNNRDNGGLPSREFDGWRNIEQYSYRISLYETFPYNIMKKDEDYKGEIDLFTLNVAIDNDFKAYPPVNIKEILKNAHFALILDIGKLRELSKTEEYSKKYLVHKREKTKFGSRLVTKDSDIKKQNIARYLSKISVNSSEISNCDKIIKRLIGNRSAIYFIWRSNLHDNLSLIANEYINILGGNKGSIQDLIDLVTVESIKSYKKSNNINIRIDKIKTNIKNRALPEQPSGDSKKMLDVIESINGLSETIYQKINNFKVDNIDDLELIILKLKSISTLVKSNRFKFRLLDSYMSSISEGDEEDRTYTVLIRKLADFDIILKDIDRINKIIEKI